jgi:hypothetical protein
MTDTAVEDIIRELQALRIRVAHLERANERVAQPERANEARSPSARETPVANGLRIGDRVRVTNKVRRPATAGSDWSEARERLATVTRVTREQVHIITDNGTRTWRGPNNLKLVHQQ